MFIYLAGFLTCESDICRNRRPPSSVYPHSLYIRAGNLMSTSQAVRDARASHSTIIDIFQRMESFFLCLDIYIEVQPTTEMMDIIIEIMVEVLSILAIATKNINQYRISELLLYH